MKAGDLSCEPISRSAESAAFVLLKRLRNLWSQLLTAGRRAPRRLRLCESLALGDRRFVAVIEFENSRFLVGGTAASLVLLDRLGAKSQTEPASNEGLEQPFPRMMKESK